MGRVSADLTLVNNADLVLAEAGAKPASEVRRVNIKGIVDTGAAVMVLPQAVADQLGLPFANEATVRYADHRTAKRQVVGQLRVELLGRNGVFTAIVEPTRTDALIGVIVLESLDFLVDPRNQSLLPRDPAGEIFEIE